MESARGFFLNYSKCIWDLNKVNNSHNCHGLKRVAQGQVSNGVERVPFWKSQTSLWGCVLQSEPPGPKSRRAEDSVIAIDYLITTFAKLTSCYTNSRVILCGDFNYLNMKASCETFKLRKLVDFATRQEAHRDNNYSDLVEYNQKECAKSTTPHR